MKIIFVTWWVVSWLGKWITASSIWRLMKSAWYSVSMIKMDPYLQVDAWTMSPYEHGEVFVTEDWAETDLDMWHYERFVNINLSWDCSITSGKIYWTVINKERKWDYLGKTVQVIPHITDEIKHRIKKIAKQSDITIVEVWWTIWDIEAPHFIEAIRQLKKDVWENNVLYVHVAPILYLKASWETKTKPIQHSVKELREAGIQADILICRSEVKVTKAIKDKISILCDVDINSVIEAQNAKSIYEVPIMFKKQWLDKIIQEKLYMKYEESSLKNWTEHVTRLMNPKWTIWIWIVWKYAEFKDAYLSLIEACTHAGTKHNTKIDIEWLQSDDFDNEDDTYSYLNNLRKEWKLDCMIVPWWFGIRWVEGKINSIKYARENKIPFLGICMWLQLAVIEYSRNVCNMKWAHSTEFEENCKYPVIDYIPEQRTITDKWWTMRLWACPAILKKWSLAYKLYWSEKISERHRHRYEVNPDYHKILEYNWLTISWMSPNKRLVEFIEIKDHPFFIWTQAHPEFKSRINHVHPLFDWLIQSAIDLKK